jgi:hypothetical protein
MVLTTGWLILASQRIRSMVLRFLAVEYDESILGDVLGSWNRVYELENKSFPGRASTIALTSVCLGLGVSLYLLNQKLYRLG